MTRYSELLKRGHNEEDWIITYKGFDPEQESLREALTTLGNGYAGTRGAACEAGETDTNYPGNYISGVFNTLPTKIAGKTIYNEDMVNCPNWLFLRFKINDKEWVIPNKDNVLSYEHKIDFRRGIMCKDMRIKDSSGNVTRIEEERIVHMKWRHISAIKYSITPENYSGKITFRTGLDGMVENNGVDRYKELSSDHLEGVAAGEFGKNGIFLHVRTRTSKVDIFQASRIRFFFDGAEKRPRGRTITKKERSVFRDFDLSVKEGGTCTAEKYVTQYTSQDKGNIKSCQKAINRVKRKVTSFDDLIEEHFKEWDRLWSLHEISVENDPFTTKILRFHTFHLLETVSEHNKDIDNGFPARGLSGESYRGHIFWDELFVIPYFAIHLPEAAKAVLMYRYRRLSAAREYADENGYEGAMFPWQSGAKGDEQTQILHLNPLSGEWGPDYSRTQRHISFDIAYNFWQYWRKTEDHDFFNLYTSEVILSVAKFAGSLVKYDPVDGRYHTEGLMGPDEFHEKLPGCEEGGLTDNAYTNFLIVWTLMRAQEVLNLAPEAQTDRLINKLDITDEELQKWDEITRKMKIIFNSEGIISQFEGYFDLKELDWDHYRKKYGDIHRMDRILKAEGRSPNDYKVAKQADVLMIFYLLPLDEIFRLFKRLGYDFDKSMLRKNYDYYLKRTSHGSTLSKVVHCYIAHLLGLNGDAKQWFEDVLLSDVDDTQGGTTPEGIHCGVMGGSLDLTLRGFAGVHTPEDGIVRIKPDLPEGWEAINVRFLYKGDMTHARISNSRVDILIEKKNARFDSLQFNINGAVHELKAGKRYSFDI